MYGHQRNIHYNYFEIYLIPVRMTTVRKDKCGGGYGEKGIINLFTDTVTTEISVEASPNTENRTTIQPAIHSTAYT